MTLHLKNTWIPAVLLFIALNSCTRTKGAPQPEAPEIDVPNIAYRNIPDSVLMQEDSMILDIDLDLNPDIIIYGTRQSYITSSGSSGAHYRYYTVVKSMHPNAMIANGPATNGWYKNFTLNEPVFQNCAWTNNLSLHNVYLTSYSGCWDSNPHDGYIDVQLNSGSGMRYAWVKLIDEVGSPALTVYEFAINADPGKPINTGQKN